jgi:hypothetical protein
MTRRALSLKSLLASLNLYLYTYLVGKAKVLAGIVTVSIYMLFSLKALYFSFLACIYLSLYLYTIAYLYNVGSSRRFVPLFR